MACEVCHHCDTCVEPGEAAVHEGLSYHRRCYECFVCGETDLRDAETFRGVIFCAGCSQRILQGCSTARQPKPAKTKRGHSGPRHRRRRRNGDRVLAMTVYTGDTDTRSSASIQSKSKFGNIAANLPPKMSDEMTLKKNSADRGTITEVTQAILKRANDQLGRSIIPVPAKPRKKRRQHVRRQVTKECSDLRIAELGTSVEIAHMPLRNQSEMPIIIKSETRLKNVRSRTLSILNQESEMTDYGDSNEGWKKSFYSLDGDSDTIHKTEKSFTSILKMPFKYFKRNILDRSSLVSGISRKAYPSPTMKKYKTLFNEDVTEHQRHGLKQLYSTINRKNTPFKLGWLHLSKTKTSKKHRSNDSAKSDKRCKHFDSHSYRCMREQVMRLAGPTHSELAILRGKIMNVFSPNIIKKIINFNKDYAAILSMQGYRRE